jgi:hypothetical protein
MASAAIQALARRAQSSANTVARMKEAAKVQQERVLMVVEVTGGAAVAGFVDGFWGRPEVFNVPAMPIVGAVAALVGLSDWVPGGIHLAQIGVGMISGHAYEWAARRGTEAAAS